MKNVNVIFNFEQKLENNKNIRLTPEQALLKAANFCAYQERCHQEVNEKLKEWGIWGEDASELIIKLIELNYLNEERFAKAFAGGKFRVKQWGRVKIKLELKYRDISDYCIRSALAEIDKKDYEATLLELLDKKWAETKGPHLLNRRAKVARYVIAKGFEQQLVWELLVSGSRYQ